MATTYIKISTVTVGSGGASTIEFTSIPQTYTDLMVRLSARTDESGQGRSYVRLRFNSSSSTIYNYCWMFGYDGDVANSVGGSPESNGNVLVIPAANATANVFGNNDVIIPNYAGSNNKSYFIDGGSENNSSSIYMVSLCSSIWSSTDAITSITFYPVSVGSANKFVQHTTATLYGIKNS